MTITISLGQQVAQLHYSPDAVRVRLGRVAGGGFYEQSAHTIAGPEMALLHDGSGWKLAALEALLERLLKGARKGDPLDALRLALRRRLQKSLRYDGTHARDFVDIAAIIAALAALGATDALPELTRLAHDRAVPPIVRDAAARARWRLGGEREEVGAAAVGR